MRAGASDGTLYIWDVRRGKGPSQTRPLAHSQFGAAAAADATAGAKRVGADVWGVQFCQTAYGELLSCGSDGSVQAWGGIETGLTPAGEVLVQLHMPVNSIHLSDLGTLAAASDAEQLTFIDMRR